MHELSIVESLVEAVRQEGRAHPAARVTAVRVRVGALRLVIAETLQFCYAAVTRDTELAGTTLTVASVPARAHCGTCEREFAVEEQWFVCPHCGAAGGRLVSGNELDLISIELEEALAAAV